jgi:hypothetical protein
MIRSFPTTDEIRSAAEHGDAQAASELAGAAQRHPPTKQP